MPKVSVIIPVYNSEKYISECLDSVLNQTFKDIEIICIDDGSTDKSFNILNRYNIKEKRITLLTQKNLGQSVARNKALEIAQGEYIYFLDSDDYIEPNLIEECIKKLDETQAGLICFNTEVVGDTSSRLFKRAEKYALLKFSGLLTLTGEVRDTLNVYLWNKMFRNDIIQKYKLRFPQNLCYEDISFSKSYFLMVDKIYMDMRRFYHYRIHENSIMTTTYKTKYVLEKLKSGMYEDFLTDEGKINWNALYVYTFNAIKEAGFEGVHFFGFDSIEAKTMRSFWNKSSSMQSMLKILRKLALENNNPVFNRLIEGCEYRLGRPDKAKEKMEQFIEDTRRIMAARAYELTKPRTMAQELISAFPAVFLVYFQWHHNFRNIYPKFPEREARKKDELQMQTRLKQDTQLREVMVQQANKWKPVQENGIKEQVKSDNTEDKLRAILLNKERTMAEMSQEKRREQQEQNTDKVLRTAELMRRINQNS